jgi:plasmid stabilization system protein ParE
MSFTILLHPDVEKDYGEAYTWYENQLEGLGENFIAAVRSKLEHIAAKPTIYSSKTKTNYREAKVNGFPFLIVYKVIMKKKVVFVSSIHHMKKHPKKKFRK